MVDWPPATTSVTFITFPITPSNTSQQRHVSSRNPMIFIELKASPGIKFYGIAQNHQLVMHTYKEGHLKHSLTSKIVQVVPVMHCLDLIWMLSNTNSTQSKIYIR